jgi:hypothetical protein
MECFDRDRAAVETVVLYKTNDLFGWPIVKLAVTNSSSGSVSVTVIGEMIDNGQWRTFSTRTLRVIKENDRALVDLMVPWKTAIPDWENKVYRPRMMPHDASPVPWRMKVIWRRKLKGAEHIAARAVEKLGLECPWNESSLQHLNFEPEAFIR